MSHRVTKTALSIVLTLVVFAVAGCATRTSGSDSAGPQAPAVNQSETTSGGSAPKGASEPMSSAEPSEQADSLDLKAIEGQLDAMQSELDSLDMPSDSDFDAAESAVY